MKKIKMNILLTALPISILGYPTTKEGCQIEINSSNIHNELIRFFTKIW